MTLAVSATFTADPIRESTAFWARELGIALELEFAPFNQTIQTLLDPSGSFARNVAGVNVLLVRFEDLGGGADELLAAIGKQAAGRMLTIVCPPSSVWSGSAEQVRLEAAFAAAGCQTYADVQLLYPVDQPLNDLGERVASLPYTDLYFAALGTFVMRRVHAWTRPPVKVLVLDCDNTLWKGVCGEDGPEGVELDPARRAVQESAAAQRRAGVVLALASKNVEQDVEDAFAAHPEFPLALSDFTTRRVNWRSKAESLESIAEELNLGLDSFVFVDDNPRECAEVREFEPQVITLALPANDEEIPEFLQHIWVFDQSASTTGEDARRGQLYEQARDFEGALASAASLAGFYASLDLHVDVRPVDKSTLARAAQLTQRTNQFNFTTIRRTESEIAALGSDCFIASVRDRFGDHGLTGLLIVKASDGSLDVETFLLSCRVLGRGVEHELLRWLGRHARSLGCRTVRLRVEPTAKNVPARDFLASLGIESGVEIAAERLENVAFAPSERPRPAKTGAPSTVSHADYERIARELRAPDRILAAMRPSQPIAAPGLNDTEAKLAAIWSELLGAPVASRRANFFDLGGHSLLAVQLLVRVQETFGVELPVDEVYSAGMTLESLAETIEAISMAALGSGEYAELLREIESLSDEEVRELLARGERGPGV